MNARESLQFRPGERVRVVGAADFNDSEGEVAWVDGGRLGVWIGGDMPTTFLVSEVVHVRA